MGLSYALLSRTFRIHKSIADIRMNDDQPLVSCIMPTYNRRKFVPHAIQYFLRQEYENKELIIIDDGTDPVEDLVPKSDLISYYRLNRKISLGAKLNLACNYAKGTIIANWDDDDWYAPRRLKYQIETLIEKGTDVCGINKLLYYDLRSNCAYQYIYPPDQRTWLLGSSLCYTKELWSTNQFADINVGMDGLFVWATALDRITVLPDSTIAVHLIHDSNVSPKKTNDAWWHVYPLREIQKLMERDWLLYDNSAATKHQNTTAHIVKPLYSSWNEAHEPLKNIYACLVHERKDCITDLVYNLHYHDKTSIILLYNGSDDTGLIQQNALFEKLGVVIHPAPRPVTYGYLHYFALDCMQFAVENFSFDILTIVDSDQLSVRSGYADYMSGFFSVSSDTGLFSSYANRLTHEDTGNLIAIQAFKEYSLWKPFINTFPQGESKFAHWTFWPSTVFTIDAIRDLIRLFKVNKQLKGIMEQTKIWASEEVILPTLVSLLGYNIATNPCSYEYVRFQTPITIQDINEAQRKPDVFWMHPVRRSYDDPVRKYIRQQFQNYGNADDTLYVEDALAEEAVIALPLVNKIKQINGLLTDGESELLVSTAIKACKALPSPQAIVEIGSYHGKSTILFGSVVKALCFQHAKVYAIDTHDGILGAAGQGLQIFPPSFDIFMKNIKMAGLSEVVEVIKNNSYNVVWQIPIALLFIDGLHDYKNVSRDFFHFSEWIVAGGYVAFHDCIYYYPDVQVFVEELLQTGQYRQVQKIDSLIVLQKV